MSDRWANADKVSARTRARVARIKEALPKGRVTDVTGSAPASSLSSPDASAITAQPVYTQSCTIFTEGYDGHRRVWMVCGDASLIETPESIAGTVIWHAERAARGGRA